MKKVLLLSIVLGLLSCCVSFADTQLDHQNTTVKKLHHESAKTKITTPVNINKADVAELETLKGLGVKKAQAIVDYRKANGDFKAVADLAHVKGIGVKMVARLEAKNPNRILVNSSQKVG